MPALQSAETSLLGGTDLARSPRTSRQSRVRVEVFASPVGERAETVFILPHKRQGSKPAIPRGYVFDLRLSARHDARAHETAAARAALDLWFGLGGLGLRARRSLGAVQPLAWSFETPTQARDALATTAAQAVEATADWLQRPLPTAPPPRPTPVPVFHPDAADVYVGTRPLEWDAFFHDLMDQIHRRQADGALPQKVLGSDRPRQESPLHVSALALTDRRVIPTFTLFQLRTDGRLDGRGPGGHTDWPTLWKNVADLAGAFHATPLALGAPSP